MTNLMVCINVYNYGYDLPLTMHKIYEVVEKGNDIQTIDDNGKINFFQRKRFRFHQFLLYNL